MLWPRIIPCLLVHEGGLVKTTGFKDPKYVGDPINAVRIFNEKEADELMVLDIDATVKNVEPNFRLIAQYAAECRMPLCYGGGVKTVEHARRIIGLGVEKVAISSVAVERPDLVAEIAGEIGRQSVVVVLDARRRKGSSEYDAYTHNGYKNRGRSVVDLAREAEQAGAGEIVVNAIDNDGVMKGYDLQLAKAVRQAVSVPLTILGGAGSLADIAALVAACGIVGAAAGSLFVFKGAYRAVLISYPASAEKTALINSSLDTRIAGNGRR